VEDSCTVLTDGHAGNERQALALADGLGLPADVLRVSFGAPWSWLAPRLVAGALRALPVDTRARLPRAPSVLIGCGRQGALATAALRARGGHFAIQILDPRTSPAAWDLVISPRHDGLEGQNVIPTLGALHALTPERLADAAARFPSLAALPSPRTAVLVGGSNDRFRIDASYLEPLVDRLDEVHARDGGSFLVSCSRRTDPSLAPMLQAFVARHGGALWRGPEDGPNPYLAMLALADRIVVTPDSVNMLSEAASTGKPVHSDTVGDLAGKFSRLHEGLRNGNHVRALDRLGEPWHQTPLREMPAVVAVVKERLASWRSGRPG